MTTTVLQLGMYVERLAEVHQPSDRGVQSCFARENNMVGKVARSVAKNDENILDERRCIGDVFGNVVEVGVAMARSSR